MRSLKQYLTIGLTALYLGLSSINCGSSSGGSSGGDGGVLPINHAPNITINKPLNNANFYRGQTVDLEAIASDPDTNDSISDSGWDASPAIFNGQNGLNGSFNIPLNSSLGSYLLTAYAKDNSNSRGDSDISINVLNNPPVANAGPNQATPIGVPIFFGGSCNDLDGTISLYEWDSNGDGIYEYNSTSSPDYGAVYSSNGCYHPSIMCTDNDGTKNTDSSTIIVGSGC